MAEPAAKGKRAPAKRGYYADPMSPIASTPMKRPRTKPANTKSAKAKNATPGSEPRANGQEEEEKRFFSPRKLANEYEDAGEDGDSGEGSQGKKQSRRSKKPTRTTARSKLAGKLDAAATRPSLSTTSTPRSGSDEVPDGAMFSPVLKVPRGTNTSSRSSSPANDTVRRHNEHVSQAESSGHNTPDIHQDTTKSDKSLDSVLCEEGSVVSEEAEETSQAPADTEFNPFVFIKSLPNYEDLVPNGRAVVLPAKSKNTPNVCLVLDLDETLVHCTVEPIENPHLQFPVTFNGVDYTVNVRKRPHMEYFLKQVAKQFEVVVFTASHRAYAEKLLNLIDPRRELIKYRLYRDDCLDVYGNYLKDLNVLGRSLSKVVLVDNSPHAFGFQVNNGIPIETWYEDEADEELLNLLPFLESLVDSDDVRPIVEKQFQIQKLIDALPEEHL